MTSYNTTLVMTSYNTKKVAKILLPSLNQMYQKPNENTMWRKYTVLRNAAFLQLRYFGCAPPPYLGSRDLAH